MNSHGAYSGGINLWWPFPRLTGSRPDPRAGNLTWPTHDDQEG